jgi:hypothetical protein
MRNRTVEAQGYTVAINWVNGQSYPSPCHCPVLAVHNPNRSGDPPDTFTTVYVDVYVRTTTMTTPASNSELAVDV